MSGERTLQQGALPREGGAVHVGRLSDGEEAGIGRLARSLGFHGFRIELDGANDKAGLLDRTARSLGFPAWFGHNWDAWFDCLADLGWHDRAPGYVLVFRHASGLHRAAPEAFDTALSILEDAARVWATRGVAFRAFVDCD